MKKRTDDNLCPICGAWMDAICSGFRHSPWADGRTYEAICDCCRNVIKTGEYINGEWVEYDFMEGKMHSLEKMLDDGWPKNQAVQAIKGVKKALKNRKKPKC